MRRVLTRSLSVLALLLPLATAAAPVPTQLDEKLIGLMDQLETKRLEHHVPGLAIAIVKDDRVIHAQGLGLADVEGQRPATPRTVFAIGSTTKAFTSALAAMYVEKKRIDWDEPLSWYLPELQLKPDTEDETATVTFRDAFSHRSGFARMGPLWAAGAATPEQVYQTASNAEPVAPFREEFHYNNVIYTAGGDALARAVGRPWEVLMRKRLLRPLGMRTATLHVDRAAKDDNLAVGYTWDEDSEDFRELPMRDIHLVAPAGAINGTVLDVAQWVRFQLAGGVIDGKRLVSAEALHETWTDQISIGENSAYGLGWMVHERNGRRVVEHGGNIDGFAAQVTLYPDDGLGYVLLMNTTASPLQQVSIALVAQALLEEAEQATEGAAPLDLSLYPGDYLANFGPFNNQAFAVSVADEKLHVNVPGQMNFELKSPDEEGKWVFALTDAIAVSFVTNEEGQVTGMKMYQSGLTFDLPRAGFEKPAEAMPAEWKEYLGRFHAASIGQNVTVLEQNGTLALDVPGQMVFELKPPVEGVWSFQVSDALQVRFDRDESGKVVSITQFRDGAELESWPRVGDAPAAAAPGDIAAVLELVQAEARGRALAELGVVRMRGTVRILSSGMTGSVEVLASGTDRHRQFMDQSPFVTVLSVMDGDAMKVDSNVGGDPHLSAKQRRQMRVAHPLSLFTDWALFFDDVSYAKAGQLGDRNTHVVTLAAEGIEPMTVHVDAENGDVLRVESLEPLGRGLPNIAVTTVFADHRDVGGLRLPYLITASNDAAGSTVVTYDSVETGVEAPAGSFAAD